METADTHILLAEGREAAAMYGLLRRRMDGIRA